MAALIVLIPAAHRAHASVEVLTSQPLWPDLGAFGKGTRAHVHRHRLACGRLLPRLARLEAGAGGALLATAALVVRHGAVGMPNPLNGDLLRNVATVKLDVAVLAGCARQVGGARRPGVALSDVALIIVRGRVARGKAQALTPGRAAEELHLAVGFLHALLAAVFCKVHTRPAIAAKVVAPHPRPFDALRLRVNLYKLVDKLRLTSGAHKVIEEELCDKAALRVVELANHAHAGNFQSRRLIVTSHDALLAAQSGTVYLVDVLRDVD